MARFPLLDHWTGGKKKREKERKKKGKEKEREREKERDYVGARPTSR